MHLSTLEFKLLTANPYRECNACQDVISEHLRLLLHDLVALLKQLLASFLVGLQLSCQLPCRSHTRCAWGESGVRDRTWSLITRGAMQAYPEPGSPPYSIDIDFNICSYWV